MVTSIHVDAFVKVLKKLNSGTELNTEFESFHFLEMFHDIDQKPLPHDSGPPQTPHFFYPDSKNA